MKKFLKQGKYSFAEQDLLGEGSFGKVYKGTNNKTNKQVALKQIQLTKLQRQGQQQFLKEILLSQISVMRKFNRKMQKDPCPFLVRQQDVFRTDKHIYIVMEICMGGTLEDEIRDRLVKEKEAIQIIYSVLKGLQYMDSMGIAHRDLKPENLFIYKFNTQDQNKKEIKIYKIGDFGFAAQKKQFDIAMGTIPYMAPQMFKKQKYTNKVDIWSLGVIAFQILYGSLYFIGKTTFQIQKNIKQKPFVLNQYQKTLSTMEYQHFLFRCLEKDPNKRASVQELVQHPLFDGIRKQYDNINQVLSAVQKQQINKLNQSIQLTKKNISQQSNQNKQQIKVFQQKQAVSTSQQQIPPKIIPQSPQNPISQPSQPVASIAQITFSKIASLIIESQQMRNIAQQFHIFSQKTGRKTQFIQLYLLKDALVMINKLTYSIIHRQNHIQLSQQQFGSLTLEENNQLYNRVQQQCIKQCTHLTGLFNQKYKWFMTEYIVKFTEEDRQLTQKVVNQQPYETVNTVVFEKELRKWENAIGLALEKGLYKGFQGLRTQCRRMLDIRLKG